MGNYSNPYSYYNNTIGLLVVLSTLLSYVGLYQTNSWRTFIHCIQLCRLIV